MSVALVLSSGVALAGYFVGTREDDQIRASVNADDIYGLRGNDTISALAGPDLVEGGPGNDTIRGGAGGDRIFAGVGRDTVFGEAGNDYINVADNSSLRDRVNCGAGAEDTVVYDKGEDGVTLMGPNGCENDKPIVP